MLLIGSLVAFSSAAAAIVPISPPDRVAVLLRYDPNMDACPSTVRPKLPHRGRDGYLSLRVGPGTAWPETDRLKPGTLMFECENTGEWAAVIVQPAGGGDCAIPRPTAKKPLLRYEGPCRRGWISARFVETVAG
jgi:hypothetical protein